MNAQDKKFNYKVILAALVAVIIGIGIAFYYSHAQSETQITYLEHEKKVLVKDLTLMKADVDRLTSLNELNEIELESSKYRIQQLLDYVIKLNFTVEKLREYKTELRRLEVKNDSLKLKNNFLKYNNKILIEKNNKSQGEINDLRSKTNDLSKLEAIQVKARKDLDERLKAKKYMEVEQAVGHAFRLKGEDQVMQTNKASTVSKLRGCVTIQANPEAKDKEKIVYFQFLDPNMRIIEDNANTVTVNGNVYSKRVQFSFDGSAKDLCDFISVPEGSLKGGIYTLNVFENEKMLSSVEFQLK